MSHLELVEDAVHVRAPAKVNLSLRCGALDEDGYHPLVTTFHAVSLFEEVTARPGEGVSVSVSGPQAGLVPTGPENLAARAALLLAEHVGVEPNVALHLRKGVPVAGGMAGGSADAAAALLACDALWRTGLSREELMELGSALGADVPFALLGHTAVGRGRGDVLTPVLARGTFHWAFAIRESGLSTPEVYRRFDELTEGTANLEDEEVEHELMLALRRGDPEALGEALHNDLEPAALTLAPELEEVLDVAREAGALGVLVSGSGPTVAALGRSAQHVLAISAAIGAAGVADEVRTATGPVPGAILVSRS